MRLGFLFSLFLIWGANLAPKWRQDGSQKCIDVGKHEHVKKVPWLKPEIVFFFLMRDGTPKIKNPSKNELNMGRRLGIYFSSILADSGTQVGTGNGPEIDPKRHLNYKQVWNAFYSLLGRGWGG